MALTSSLVVKRVLVTWGSRGIGDAIVRRLASQGAEVAVNHRSDRAAAEALAVITGTTIEADGGWS
jgi:3-oxoacyl-[acyl-carrier protein] reductase